jgi:hypothetical protein
LIRTLQGLFQRIVTFAGIQFRIEQEVYLRIFGGKVWGKTDLPRKVFHLRTYPVEPWHTEICVIGRRVIGGIFEIVSE